jgi:hypothetical protein
MTERAEADRRARERLDAKRDDPGAIAVRGASRVEEISKARADLAGTLPLLIEREAGRRDDDLRTAAEVVASEIRAGRGRDANLSGPARERYAASLARAEQHDTRVQRLEAISEEKRATLRVSVRREPRVYGELSPYSYFADHFAASLPGHRDHAAANERLRRHAHEVGLEASGLSDEGLRARRAIGETRGRETGRPAEELRALTSASGSGGALVTPQYLTEDYAVWRNYPPSFWMQSVPVTDEGFGMEVYLPAYTSGTSADQQVAENAGVSDASPTAQYLSCSLVTMTGEVEVSQQVIDRAGPGPGFDVITNAQLTEDLNAAVDSYMLTQAIAGAGTVTDSTSFSVTDLWADLGKARSQMRTTAGAKLQPTHLFIAPDPYEYYTSQVDGNGRPLLTPVPAGASLAVTPGPDGGPPLGATGLKLLSTPVFSDGNIPNFTGTTNTQIVLASMSDVFTIATEPVLRVVPETFSSTLTVVIQLYRLVGIIVRHAAACQVVSGSAYPATPSFA